MNRIIHLILALGVVGLVALTVAPGPRPCPS